MSSPESPENRIYFDESLGICEASVVQVCRKMPPVMESHLSKSDWEAFCSKIDKDLKHLTAVRTIIMRFIFLYVVVMAALYVVVEILDMFEDIFKYPLAIEFLISLGILAAVMLLYVIKARCSAKSRVRRHCYELTRDVCPRLKLQCKLPFCQYSCGIARGWYIAIEVKSETA